MQQAETGLTLNSRRTQIQEFLAQMERLVLWAELEALVEPYEPKSKTGRPPLALQTMLRIHFMQQWFTLGAPAMEDAPRGAVVSRVRATHLEPAAFRR